MAIIRDMIPAFELFQPTTVEDALALMAEHGEAGWVLAGGLDSYDWFKAVSYTHLRAHET